MGEAELIVKYDDYIARHARSYLRKTGQPEHMYDDLKSEATLAFLETVRRYQIEQENMTPREYLLTHNAMRNAMRCYVWNYHGEKDKNKRLEYRSISFSDCMSSDESDGDESRLDFLGREDDYSSVEVQDAINRLPEIERETLNYLLKGYSPADIARLRNTSRKNVSATVERLKVHLKDISS